MLSSIFIIFVISRLFSLSFVWQEIWSKSNETTISSIHMQSHIHFLEFLRLAWKLAAAGSRAEDLTFAGRDPIKSRSESYNISAILDFASDKAKKEEME